MCDVDGLLTTTRSDGNLEGHKEYYAKDVEPMKNLGEIVKKVKPSVCNALDVARDVWLFTSFVLVNFV